jgi:sarcosine oxidase, subunit gamma
VSAAERARADSAGIRLTALGADIVQIAHLRSGAQGLAGVATARGWPLPRCGGVTPAAHGIALSVRPGRWLLLSAPASPGESAAGWQAACAGSGAAVDLSAALAALYLTGPAVREVLARGCRLDLAPEVFRPGCAAATIVAQVSVILAALPQGVLLLTPATTAGHFREWLTLSAVPFGLVPQADATVAQLSGDRLT